MNGVNDNVAKLIPGFRTGSYDKFIVILTKVARFSLIQLPEAFDSQILKVNKFTFVEPFQGLNINIITVDGLKKVFHNLFVGFIIGGCLP